MPPCRQIRGDIGRIHGLDRQGNLRCGEIMDQCRVKCCVGELGISSNLCKLVIVKVWV